MKSENKRAGGYKPTGLNIGIDIDDIITDTAQALANELNRLYGYRFTLEDFTCYGVENCTEATQEQVSSILNNPEFYANLDLKPGAVEGLQELRALGNCIFLITARPYEVWKVTLDYLRINGVFYHYLLFNRNKAVTCIKHKIRAYLDDRYESILETAEAGVWSFLPDRPWNGGMLPSNATRLSRYDYWAQFTLIFTKKKSST